MVILTIILVKVLCCLYQSPKHYIEICHERPFSLHQQGHFRYTSKLPLQIQGEDVVSSLPIRFTNGECFQSPSFQISCAQYRIRCHINSPSISQSGCKRWWEGNLQGSWSYSHGRWDRGRGSQLICAIVMFQG